MVWLLQRISSGWGGRREGPVQQRTEDPIAVLVHVAMHQINATKHAAAHMVDHTRLTCSKRTPAMSSQGRSNTCGAGMGVKRSEDGGTRGAWRGLFRCVAVGVRGYGSLKRQGCSLDSRGAQPAHDATTRSAGSFLLRKARP